MTTPLHGERDLPGIHLRKRVQVDTSVVLVQRMPLYERGCEMDGITTVNWSDQLIYAGTGGGSNRHRGTMVFVRGDGAPVKFDGESIDGVCRVSGGSHVQNGKWSYTTWTVQVAPGYMAWGNRGGVVGCLNAEGQAETNYNTVMSWDGVAVPHAVFRALCPNTAKRLDENERPI